MTLIEIFQCLLELVLLLFKITENGKIIKGAKKLHASFISNVKLKLAKNHAKAKQQPEAEPLPIENYSLYSSTLSSKNNSRCTKSKYVCLNEVIW